MRLQRKAANHEGVRSAAERHSTPGEPNVDSVTNQNAARGHDALVQWIGEYLHRKKGDYCQVQPCDHDWPRERTLKPCAWKSRDRPFPYSSRQTALSYM
jgi:hypothetical protein